MSNSSQLPPTQYWYWHSFQTGNWQVNIRPQAIFFRIITFCKIGWSKWKYLRHIEILNFDNLSCMKDYLANVEHGGGLVKGLFLFPLAQDLGQDICTAGGDILEIKVREKGNVFKDWNGEKDLCLPNRWWRIGALASIRPPHNHRSVLTNIISQVEIHQWMRKYVEFSKVLPLQSSDLKVPLLIRCIFEILQYLRIFKNPVGPQRSLCLQQNR